MKIRLWLYLCWHFQFKFKSTFADLNGEANPAHSAHSDSARSLPLCGWPPWGETWVVHARQCESQQANTEKSRRFSLNNSASWGLLSHYVHGDCFRPISQLHTRIVNLFSYLGALCGMIPRRHLPFNLDEQFLWRDQLIKADTDRLGKIQCTGYKLRTFQVLRSGQLAIFSQLLFTVIESCVFSEVLLRCRFISNLFKGCGFLLAFPYRYFLLPLICGFQKVCILFG